MTRAPVWLEPTSSGTIPGVGEEQQQLEHTQCRMEVPNGPGVGRTVWQFLECGTHTSHMTQQSPP